MKLRNAVAALFVLQFVMDASVAEAQGRRSRNVITAEEIAKATAADAYALLGELRPEWFSSRGAAASRPDRRSVSGDATAGGIVVYVDGIPQNDVEDLKSLVAERIKEARFYNASDATTRFGTRHPSGAIEITTKR